MLFHYPNNSGTFEIDGQWWSEAGMNGFCPRNKAFPQRGQWHWDGNIVFKIIPLLSIESPKRAEGILLFKKDRMIRILEGIRNSAPIPPIEIQTKETGDYPYTVHNGVHRFYASIAVGFTHVPAFIGNYL